MFISPKSRHLTSLRLAIVWTAALTLAVPVTAQELRFPSIHVTDATHHRVADEDAQLLASTEDAGSISPIAAPIYSEGDSCDSGWDAAPSSALVGIAGFMDSAIIQNQFRLRFDAISNATFPDRAVFQFAPRSDLHSVDYREVSGYLEYVIRPRVSVFADVPVRFVDALNYSGISDTEQGVGDISLGLRYAAIEDCNRAVTLQLLFRAPTGAAGDLGGGDTNFVDVPIGLAIPRIEPGILFQSQRDERTTLFGEFKVNVPLEEVTDPAMGITEDFAGTVLRYGVGVGYDLYNDSCCDRRLTSVAEFVGWSVMGGQKTRQAGPPYDAEDTIVMINAGGRWTQGDQTFYAGYGVALTDQVWYENLFRADYTMRF